MNRQGLITFLLANMRNAVIPFIKENKDSFGIEGTVTQSAVKTWISDSKTTDEMLLSLATDCGYTADSAPASAKASIEIGGLIEQSVTVDTTSGEAQVPCYMLPVKKWDVAKSTSRTTGKVTYTPVLKLDILGKTMNVYHEMFRNKEVRDSIQPGDTVAIRTESVQVINGSDRIGNPYTSYRGALLEASIDAIGQARLVQAEREIELAGMSKEAQQLVNGSSAEQEAKAFFAKFGK